MAHYKATVHTELPPAQAFDLMANFANAQDWDPATLESHQLGDAPVDVGSRFELTMEIFGRENSIVYEVVEYDAPSRVVLRGENAGSVSIDEIAVAPHESGSAVTYEATVTMKGAYKVIGPFFAPVFKKMGDEAQERIAPWLDKHATDSS
ncbi:MAG: SRPBCC family protein [Thermoleophilaceae bacterium]|nr:SRPBCC family protein [Thermoleophilaceae bacterium]